MRDKQSSDSRQSCVECAFVTLAGGGLDLPVGGKGRCLHPRMANPARDRSALLLGDCSLCPSIAGTSQVVGFIMWFQGSPTKSPAPYLSVLEGPSRWSGQALSLWLVA